MNKAYLTAIGRKNPSVPARMLTYKSIIIGRTLDYGCGRGFDADYYSFAKYDPHYYPEMPKGLWDTVLCSFVLNVLQPNQVGTVVADIKSRLETGGTAYLTVRRDIKTEGYTSKGTYQHNVVLDLPVLFKNNKFCIYELRG